MVQVSGPGDAISEKAQPVEVSGTKAPVSAEVSNVVDVRPSNYTTLPTTRLVLILGTLYGISASTAIGTGLVTVALPQIASDFQLPDGLILWPGIATALASGTCFLLSGSVADLLGSRVIGLVGCLIMIAALAGAGGAQTGVQFIIIRALHGIGASMYLPTTTSLWTSTVGPGRTRNVGFAVMSFAGPVGLQTGYLLAGGLEKTSLSWRFTFYLAAGIMFFFGSVGYLIIPKRSATGETTAKKVIYDLDLLGIALITAALGLLNYSLAEISNSVDTIKTARVLACLVTSIVIFVIFFLWQRARGSKGLRPLINNSLWRNWSFVTMCILMTLACGTSNAIEWFFSLYFQQVQDVSALDTALRFIPNVLIGIVTGLVTGFLLDRLPTNIFVSSSAAISAAAPLIMALIDPSLSWWVAIFWALLTSPTAQDVMYTVSSVIITEKMPKSQHGLAGGVLNTLGYVGTSIIMAIMAIVSNSQLQSQGASSGDISEAQYLRGYRAAFWVNFGLMAVMIFVGLFLRRDKVPINTP